MSENYTRNHKCGFLNRLMCKIGWHKFTCKMQDCIDEFGFIPNDGRMPRSAKCERCGVNYKLKNHRRKLAGDIKNSKKIGSKSPEQIETMTREVKAVELEIALIELW